MNRSIIWLLTGAFLFVSPGKTQAQVALLSEDFDLVTAPELPANWAATGLGWATSTASSSTGSGANNLAHTGGSIGAIDTPEFDFSGYVSGSLTYLARRTSSYPQDSLVVFASTDGGTTYPFEVSSLGQALPGATSSYESILLSLPADVFNQSSVRFRFVAFGGSTGGSNMRLDDVLLLAVPDSTTSPPPSSQSSIGFQSAFSAVLESTSTDPISIDLVAADTLQGVQFALSWSSPLISLLAVDRGPAIADSSSWQLDWAISNDSLKVILLGNGLNGLLPGGYQNLFSVRFQASSLSGGIADTVQLSLSDALGSVSHPAGLDAGLTISMDAHEIVVQPPGAFLQLSTDLIEFGSVKVDSTAVRTVGISNPLGSKDLLISAIVSDNMLFNAVDSVLTVAPDQTVVLSIEFTPSEIQFGDQKGTLSLLHDGLNGPTATIGLSGFGIAGRGDVDSDGLVDVLDLVIGIDVSLQRLSLPAVVTARIDLFPFPQGDGQIDVRDLTVLTQAIVRDNWPDNQTLPATGAAPKAVVSGTSGYSDAANAVTLLFESKGGSTYDVFLNTFVALRGFEFSLSDISGVSSVSDGRIHESAVNKSNFSGITESFYDQKAHIFRSVLASSETAPISPGLHGLGQIELNNGSERPNITYSTAVNIDRERIPVFTDAISIGRQVLLDVPSKSPILGSPYPNPFVVGPHNSVTIPVTLGDLTVRPQLEIYDLLGRRLFVQSVELEAREIEWSPNDPDTEISPGLYFIRLTAGKRSVTRTITVVRGT